MGRLCNINWLFLLGVFRGDLGCSGVIWGVSVCSGVDFRKESQNRPFFRIFSWGNLGNSGDFWGVLGWFGAFWWISVCSGVNK